MFPTASILVEGDLALDSYTAVSGNMLSRGFCANCGTHILAMSSARPQYRVVRLGAIDEPHGLRPSMVIWTDDAPAWAIIDPTLDHHARQPPPMPADGMKK